MCMSTLRALEFTEQVLHTGGSEDRRAFLEDAAARALAEMDQLSMHVALELDRVRSSE